MKITAEVCGLVGLVLLVAASLIGGWIIGRYGPDQASFLFIGLFGAGYIALTAREIVLEIWARKHGREITGP